MRLMVLKSICEFRFLAIENIYNRKILFPIQSRPNTIVGLFKQNLRQFLHDLVRQFHGFQSEVKAQFQLALKQNIRIVKTSLLPPLIMMNQILKSVKCEVCQQFTRGKICELKNNCQALKFANHLIINIGQSFLMQEKKQSSKAPECLPSNQLASRIVKQLLGEGDGKYSLEQLLVMLRDRKNPNHAKVTEHVQAELVKMGVPVAGLIPVLSKLATGMNKANNTGVQVSSVYSGFNRHILNRMAQQDGEGDTYVEWALELVAEYFQFPQKCCPPVAAMIASVQHQLNQKDQQKISSKLVDELREQTKYKKMKEQLSSKCCTLIEECELYSHFSTSELTYLMGTANLTQVISLLRNKRGGVVLHELAAAYIRKHCLQDTKAIKRLVDQLGLNAFDYPEYIAVLNKKTLNYLLNEYPIYCIDLYVEGREDIVHLLVEVLLERGRQKEALHFINKYYIKSLYHLNPTDDKSYNKNLLKTYDDFVPTEHILAKTQAGGKYAQKEYLTTQELSFKEKDVLFVDDTNLSPDMLRDIMNSPCLGLDTESIPAFNGHETATLSIIQVAINYKVTALCDEDSAQKQTHVKKAYILDVLSLAKSELFVKWFARFCRKYRGNIIGHTVQQDFTSMCRVLVPQLAKQKIERVQIVDISQEFRNKRKSLKCSLEFICGEVMSKNLSKFQQCSGWQNRPLRRAQLHYAALDAIVPLYIRNKI